MNKYLFLIIPIIAVLISGCTEQPPALEPVVEPENEAAIEEPSGILKGVSLSPRSSSADDFTGFFEEAVQAGKIVMKHFSA